MEIYTTDLLGLTIQENRLQSNFQVINTVLKDLQQQVAGLGRQHDQLLQSLLQNKHQIDGVSTRTQKHHSLLLQHKNWIEQLNAQFATNQDDRSEPEQPQQEISQPVRQQSREEMLTSKHSEEKKSERQLREKRSEKGGFQEMIGGMKERIKALEKEKQMRDGEIEEIRRFLGAKRPRESEQRRGSMLREYCAKSSGSKKDVKHSTMLIELKENQEEEKPLQGAVANRRTPSLPSQQEFNIGDFGLGIDDRLTSLAKELQRVKQAFAEKNRILDAQLKESHQKVQGLQKSVDILQRSHDMLKYDFQRTSTSSGFGKGRNEHQSRVKREERLNDTRVTNKEYYQQKLVELFTEMDQLRGEYYQLQAKLEKQAEDEPEESRGDGKVRIAQKLTGSQKEGEQSYRREMIVQRAQLRKLRAQFNQFALGINSGGGEVRTVVIKPNQNKEDWKSLSTKMQRLRSEMQAGLKEVQGKVATSNEVAAGLGQMEAAIEEVRLLLRRKVESSEFDKTAKRLQGRLNNFIMQVFEKQGQEAEFDAALARQPWFCLSCDSELKGFSGKVGRTNPIQKLAGRKVNPESHMVRRNDNGRLPSVIK